MLKGIKFESIKFKYITEMIENNSQILQILNEENVSESELQNYKVRRAVRIILIDEDKKIAILYSLKGDYYSLPGGGVEDTETYEKAVLRECLEETGCNTELLIDLGMIEEVRQEKKIINRTKGFVGKVIGEKGIRSLELGEIEEELELLWVDALTGLELIEKAKQTKLYFRYVQMRDVEFLKQFILKEVI